MSELSEYGLYKTIEEENREKKFHFFYNIVMRCDFRLNKFNTDDMLGAIHGSTCTININS